MGKVMPHITSSQGPDLAWTPGSGPFSFALLTLDKRDANLALGFRATARAFVRDHLRARGKKDTGALVVSTSSIADLQSRQMTLAGRGSARFTRANRLHTQCDRSQRPP
jgi:hypothetical protein